MTTEEIDYTKDEGIRDSSMPEKNKSEKVDLKDQETQEKEKQETLEKSKSEETDLKGNIIDVKKTIEDFVITDGRIDKEQAANFNINMTKLGYYSYDQFSKDLNNVLLKDKNRIAELDNSLSERKIDSTLTKIYIKRLEQMASKKLPDNANMETVFGTVINESFFKLTKAYLPGTYEKLEDTETYHIEHGEEKNSTEKLEDREMKKVSKQVIKFLNNESLSSTERQQIRFFIRTLAGIEQTNNNSEPIEKTILEFFENNINDIPSYTRNDRTKKLNGLKIRDIDAKRLQKLGQLYYQSMGLEHPMLRRLFGIIQQEGSISNVKSNFQDSIEKSKKNEKYIKNQSERFELEDYPIGDLLGYQKEELARSKAYITTIKSEEREKTDSILNAITDFDLNGFITHKDASNKTGLQIQKMISNFGKEESLKNILALSNKIGSKFEIGEITKSNLLNSLESPAYLLFIQNSLKNPSFDISDIIRYGDSAVENIYNLSEESINIVNYNTNKIKNELEKKGIPVDTGLKDIVSTSILKAYNESAFGIGIPLDKFVKGLSFNLGSATIPNGTESFGINIGLNGKTDLGKKREATGGMSVGTSLIFIPMASIQGGVMKTFDNNKQSTSLDIRTNKKFQLSGHAVVMPGVLGYGASLGIDRNKRDSTLEQGQKLKPELEKFFAKILEPVQGKDKFEFNKTELIKKLETNLNERFDDSKKDTITKAVNNMSLILAAYDGLPKEKILEASTKIAESYANAWINQSAVDMNKQRYVGGAGLSVTFFEGIIPIVGIINLKQHKITSYNDLDLVKIKSAEKLGEGNEMYKDGLESFIKEINKNTGSEIKLEGEFITIPKSTRTEKNLEIRINENMKGFVKRNEAGDLILHKDTPIRFFDAYLSDRGRKVLNIGDFSSTSTDKKLDERKKDIPYDFVTTGEITKDKLPILEKPNTENVNKILDDLKKQLENTEKDSIKDLKAEINGTTIIFKTGSKEENLENISNQSKIIISKKPDGSLSFEKEENEDQKRLTIQYKENISETKEIDDEKTNKIISQVYADGREITDNLFHNIIHHNAGKGLTADYDGFNKNLKEGKYSEAKTNLSSMLENINEYTTKNYKKESFVTTRKNIKGMKEEDEDQTIKVLSAFNVLLSRTASVKIDNKGNYTYQYGGEQINNGKMIIEESEKRVLEGGKKYPGGFLQQLETYRPKTQGQESNLTKNNVNNLFEGLKSARKDKNFKREPKQTEKTIAFNHGNPQDFFKLQVNPEIVDNFRIGLKDLTNLDENFKNDLKSAYINQLIETEPNLIKNILTKVGLKTLDKEQTKDLFNGKSLDIDNKIYTLEYIPSFAYNPECNNLMRLMEDIKIKTTKNIIKEASLESNTLMINYTETSSQTNMQEKRINIAGGYTTKNGKITTTPGETEVPTTTPGEKPIDIPGGDGKIPTTGGPGQGGSQGGGRE